MAIAALIAWLITALGGFWMLGIWITKGGMSQQRSGASRFPVPVIFGHFLLAAAGWPGTASIGGTAGGAGDHPAERHLPVPVIIGHGAFAVVTLLLVLLTAAGGS
jgi:hypothetical protein